MGRFDGVGLRAVMGLRALDCDPFSSWVKGDKAGTVGEQGRWVGWLIWGRSASLKEVKGDISIA